MGYLDIEDDSNYRQKVVFKYTTRAKKQKRIKKRRPNKEKIVRDNQARARAQMFRDFNRLISE